MNTKLYILDFPLLKKFENIDIPQFYVIYNNGLYSVYLNGYLFADYEDPLRLQYRLISVLSEYK